MQCANDKYFIRRSVAYASSVYLSQRNKDKDTGYSYMAPVTLLGILNFTIFPKKESYISHHTIRDIVTDEHDIDIFSFSFIELPKFDKTIDELETVTDRWSYFFKEATALDPDVVDKMKEDMPILDKAFGTLSASAYTEGELLANMRFEMKEGEILGRIRRKAMDVAVSMLYDGMSIDLVSKYVDFTAEEIEEYVKEIEKDAVSLLDGKTSVQAIMEYTGLPTWWIEKLAKEKQDA
jgi:predicted transposase/invertase (TIGR01784 family)